VDALNPNATTLIDVHATDSGNLLEPYATAPTRELRRGRPGDSDEFIVLNRTKLRNVPYEKLQIHPDVSKRPCPLL
jgi:hypothetical protein